MNRTVLIVDDSASMRLMLRITLGQAGYRVVEAGDGVEALEMLQGASTDLVICDLHMPRMDGLGFLRALNDQARLNAVPTLMLTTELDPRCEDRVRAAGAGAWLNKPFHPEHLIATVNELIGQTA